MLDDLKANQMHSALYLGIVVLLIIPFILCTAVVLFGIFVLHWGRESAQLTTSLRIALILGLPAFILHCVCAMIAGPHAEGYVKPEPVYEDPLTDYFPGERYYRIGAGQGTKKARERGKKNFGK